jgi:hypothetical protein
MRNITQTLIAVALLALSVTAGAQVTRSYGTITTQNLVPTGACTAGGCVEIDVTNKAAVGVEVTGTYAGAISAQVTTDGATWKTIAPSPFVPATATGTPTATIGSGVTGQWQIAAMVPGSLKLRVTALAAVTGTATITLQSSSAPPASAGGSAGGGLTDAELRASAVPVSGTVTANLGTLNGAATAAKQPALGTAGTASADVISVQGIASGTALAVSGTVTANAAQSGTWTVQPGNTANTTAWKVDGSAVTQPVSIATAPVLVAGSAVIGRTGLDFAGTAGSAGAGAVDAGTIRTTQASDSPLVAALGSTAITFAEDAAHNSGERGIPALAVRRGNNSAGCDTDGDYCSLLVNATGYLKVNGGAVASGTQVSGNPTVAAGEARTSNITAEANGDALNLITTTVGALIAKPYSIPETDWAYAAATSGISNTTTAVTMVAAAAAGIRNYVTRLDLMCEALGTATEVAVRDGAGGSVLWRTKVGTGGQPLIHIAFPNPIKSTAATLLEVVTLTASGTGACYVNAGGYQAP